MAGIIESFIDAVVDLHNSLTRKIFFVIILKNKQTKNKPRCRKSNLPKSQD